MSDKINWDDGSFEFIDANALKKLDTKKYLHSSHPFVNCKFCLEKKCNIYRTKAAEVSQLIFNRYFDENTNDASFVLSTLEKLPNDLRTEFGLADGQLASCVAIHLVQKIDEETMIDVSDELIQNIIKKFLK